MDMQVCTTWHGTFPCRAPLQQNNSEQYANYSQSCDTPLNNNMATEDACEPATQISQVEDRKKTPNSNQKRHGGIKFILCLVLCSNVLSLSALAVAIACILLWKFEVMPYRNQLMNITELINNISMSAAMWPWSSMSVITESLANTQHIIIAVLFAIANIVPCVGHLFMFIFCRQQHRVCTCILHQ